MPCFGIGCLTHNIVNKAIQGGNAASTFTTAEPFGTMNIKGSNISPSTTSGVFLFLLHWRAWLRRISSMTTTLNSGFLLGRQNKLVILKGMPIPYPFIENQNAPGFLGKLRITRKYPNTITLRTNGILMKPSPYGAVTHSGCQSRSSNLPAQVGNTTWRKWYSVNRWPFKSQDLNLNDNLRGENRGTYRTKSFFKPKEPFFKETFSPYTDNFTGSIKLLYDLIIVESLGCKENHIGV